MLTLNDIQQILDAIEAHTIVCNKNEIVLANLVVSNWLSIEQDGLQGVKIQDFVCSESNESVKQAYDSLRQGAPSTSLRIMINPPHQGTVWIDATAKPAPFLDGQDLWVVTFVPLRNLPKSTTKNADRSEQQFDNLENNTILATMIEENHFVNTALSTFLDTLQDIVPYDSTSITLLNGNELQFIIARGFPADTTLNSIKVESKKPISERATILYQNETGAVYHIADVREHKQWIDIDGTSAIRSSMGIELFYNQQLFGVLNIDANTPNFFTVDHARHALALSQQAILALVYSHLYQQFYQEHEEHQRLQRVLVKNLISTETMFASQNLLYSSEMLVQSLPVLISMISSSMKNTEVMIVVFNPATSKLIYKMQSNVLALDLWDALREVIQRPDLPKNIMPEKEIKTLTSRKISLTNGEHAVVSPIGTQGVLFALRQASSEPFDEAENELISTIANQLSIKIRNEQLDKQLLQHTQHLEQTIEQRTAQLYIERKRLQAILDATADGIFYMEDFKIEYANPAFCKMVGYEMEELRGNPLSFVRVTPPVAEAQNFNALLNNPLEVKPGRSETRLRHHDGTEFYASIRFSLMGQPGENPVRMVAIARDISQERKLYIQRARFIANAAHELRTPLSSLILRLHMLHRQPDRVETHLVSLDKVALYLKNLVEELLAISRYERGSIILETDTILLQPLVKQAVDEQISFAQELQVSINLTMPDEPIQMTGDSKRLHQMVSNLLINGINYSHPDETVIVRLSVEVDSVDNENVILQVIDKGDGIESDLLPADIFEPFARPSGGKRKETGMGLALVKEIANLHGGSIHVKSKVDQGSTFRVVLPLN